MAQTLYNTKEYYALLDYDGFVCKSFYANKEDIMNSKAAKKILKDLVDAAIEKACNYFNVDRQNLAVLKVMSGHSWKKDIYPSYKRTRKRNEYLGIYRGSVIEEDKAIIVPPQLEADEVLVCVADYLRDKKKNIIIFSDDKDLRYYSEIYCKINITEQIKEQDILDIWKAQLEQLLIGDREDNIKGVPKVGEKTAPKLLESYGYSIDGVIRCFKDHGIDIDNCLRDLLLTIPLSSDYTQDKFFNNEIAKEFLTYGEADDLDIHKSLISQVQYLNKKVCKIYES